MSSTVITALIAGLGLGAGLWSILVWLCPPRPTLATVLARASGTMSKPVENAPGQRSGIHRVLHPVERLLQILGLPTTTVSRDLAVLDRDPSVHRTHQALVVLGGLGVPVVLAALLGLSGTAVEPLVLIAASLALAVLAGVAADLHVRAVAAQARTDFRYALSAYLDLVAIMVAGGAGMEAALTTAAHVGTGTPFTRLRRTVSAARLTRTTPWAQLRQLGSELTIPELAELAASLSLAGTEGATLRATLAAKAAGLRARQLTQERASAQAATERMTLPLMALFSGFLIFIGYPALSTILTAL